jgi:uncharacterized protein (TIGR03000 family)
MRRVLAILVCCFGFTPSAFAQPIVFPDGSTSDQPGGLMIIRKGNQTTWSLGGVLLPRSVKVVTRTPDGKEITRFKMPSVFQDPYQPPLPSHFPAAVRVEVPDPHALLFVEGELVRTKGTRRELESPALAPGKAYPLRVRAAYVVGEEFLIEDKEVLIRPGESTAVTFDGSRAVRVPLQKPSAQARDLPK